MIIMIGAITASYIRKPSEDFSISTSNYIPYTFGLAPDNLPKDITKYIVGFYN